MPDRDTTGRSAGGPPPRRNLPSTPTAAGAASTLVKGFRPPSAPAGEDSIQPAIEEAPATPVAVSFEEPGQPAEGPGVADAPPAVEEQPTVTPDAQAGGVLPGPIFAQPVAAVVPVIPAQPAPAKTPKSQLSFELPTDLRARARAAFRVTQYAEGHPSFRDFMNATLLREVERLENLYNNGQRWEGGEIPLPGGRKMGI